MRLLKDETIVVVIDIQEKLFPHIAENDILTENCKKIIEGLKILEIPFLVTEQYTKGLGSTIPEIKEVLGDLYKPIEKIDFSCCGSSEFLEVLRNSGKKNVVLIGIETHVCVLQTALDLLSEGFQPVLIEDCVSSRSLINKKIAVQRMLHEGCIVSTYESILFELCRKAGNDLFKAISKLVK